MNTPTEEAKEAERKRVEKPLTREQRRRVERIEKEAKQTLAQLQEKFLKCVIESDDPEGEDVIKKVDQISAQWKLYCDRKGLLPVARNLILDYCLDVLKEYQNNKKSDPQPEAKTGSVSV